MGGLVAQRLGLEYSDKRRGWIRMPTVSNYDMQAIQRKLQRYYLLRQRREILQAEYDKIKSSIELLQDRLRTMSEHVLDYDKAIHGIRYDKPIVSDVGYVQSPLDRAAEAHCDIIMSIRSAITKKQNKLVNIEIIMQEIDIEIEPVSRALQMFEERSQKLIEMRYGDKLKFFQIGQRMHLSESAVRKMHDEIIEQIAALFAN
jgi:DNA-directed RNA polymerase specialized sigma subunit